MKTLCLSSRWHDVAPTQPLTDRHTWGELYRDLGSVLEVLQSSPYQRIALHSRTHYEFIVGLLGLLYARKSPIIFMDDPVSYQTMKGHYEALLTFDPSFDVGVPNLVVSLDPVGLVTQARLPEGVTPLEPTQVITLFTSGSTQTPTCVPKTLRALDTEAALLLPKMNWDNRQIASTVDPHHLYGLSFVIWAGLTTHTPIHEMRLAFTEDVDALQGSHMLVTTPTFMRLTPDTPTPANLVLMMSAGGQLTEPIFEKVRTWSTAPILDVYGSTETGAIATRHHEDVYAKTWTLIPNATLTPLDKADGVHWRLFSPILDTPYFDLSDNLVHGEDGTFILVGRRDRIAKIGEVRLSLTRIEAIIQEVFGWESKAVVVRRGERDAIGVVINRAASPTFNAALVRAYRTRLRTHLEPLAIPRYWRTIASWPYNPQGKIEMPRLLALFDHHE